MGYLAFAARYVFVRLQSIACRSANARDGLSIEWGGLRAVHQPPTEARSRLRSNWDLVSYPINCGLDDVLKPDPPKQFRACPICDPLGEGCPIIIRIEVDPRRTLAKGVSMTFAMALAIPRRSVFWAERVTRPFKAFLILAVGLNQSSGGHGQWIPGHA